MYRKFIKRFLDILFALFGLVLTIIPLLIAMAAIRIDSKGSPVIRQKRVGLNKKHFSMYKLRTMSADTPFNVPTHLLENPESYITKVGAFLRKTSIDEIPQLVNILKGDMSIVGPRPALWNQYDLIEERDKYNANSVAPGLTGWAQINGRDELPICEKARLDGEYVKQLSFAMDAKCFFRTFISVAKQEGYAEGRQDAKDSNVSG